MFAPLLAPLFGALGAAIGFVILGPGLFTVAYIVLRFRDREDPQLGLKATLSYLHAISLQAAFASAAFLLWVGLELWAGRVGGGAPPEQTGGGWRGAIGTLLVNALLSLVFYLLLTRKTNHQVRPAAFSLYRGFGAYLCGFVALGALSGLSWAYFAGSSGPYVSAALAIGLVYAPAATVLIAFSLRGSRK